MSADAGDKAAPPRAPARPPHEHILAGRPGAGRSRAGEADKDAPFWETTPLTAMTRDQWESLCDGCGRCCVHKLEDDETGELFPTNVACRLLDGATAQCKDYRNRKAHVPECVRLTPAKLETIDWLPSSCAYLRVHRGQGLADWHPLVSGDPDSVHRAGISVRGWTISEDVAGDLENHIIDEPL